jgi:hypothetical protein
MSILSVLTAAPTRKHPALSNHFLVWMPKSEAATPTEARLKYRALVTEAYLKTLPSPYSVKGTMEITPYGIVETGYVLQGADCNLPSIECTLEPYVSEPEEIEIGPSWLNGAAVYHWQNYLPGRTGDYPLATVEAYHVEVDSAGRHHNLKKLPLAGEAEHLHRMSALLPDWVYIYSAPTKDRPYPVIFHRGETLYFIEPETTAAN